MRSNNPLSFVFRPLSYLLAGGGPQTGCTGEQFLVLEVAGADFKRPGNEFEDGVNDFLASTIFSIIFFMV